MYSYNEKKKMITSYPTNLHLMGLFPILDFNSFPFDLFNIGSEI